MKLDRKDCTYVRTFALPVLRRFACLGRWGGRSRRLSSLTHQCFEFFEVRDPVPVPGGFDKPTMGLQTDIRTVLIVSELQSAIGISVVVFAAELAYNNISLWNTRCFIAGFGWIGLIFLFERDGYDESMMGLGSTNHSLSIGYRAGSRSSSILETRTEHESKIINCGDRDWYITACGHLIENGNPIEDIRYIDFFQ